MSLIDTLRALAITVRNEKKKEANSAVRIGDLFIAIIDFIKSVQSGEIRQVGVDTYNDTSGGKTSLLNEYPNPELNWTVLVRNDETNGGKASLYKWNGSNWVNLETVVYADDVATKQDVYNITFPPITEDGEAKRLIDVFWGATIYKDLSWHIRELNKTTGVVTARNNSSHGELTGVSTQLEGFELLKLGSGGACIFVLINWDIEDKDYSNTKYEVAKFTISYPVSEIGKRIFTMFDNKQFRITDNAVFNDDGIIQKCDCSWVDGTSGTMTLSNYDSATLEYRSCSVTYGGLTITYGIRSLNELGETIKQGLISIS